MNNDPYNYNYNTQQTSGYQIPPSDFPPFPATSNSPPYTENYNGFDQQQHQSNEYMDDGTHSIHDPTATSTELEPPAPTNLTPEQVARQRFAWSSIGLCILSVLLVIGCILSTVIKALDMKGVKGIVSLVIGSLLNLAVVIVALFGMVSSLLNKKGLENWRYRTAVYNLVGMVILCLLETLYLVITNVLIPLLGIAMFFIGMIFVVLFYGPCIFVAAYRLYLMRLIPGAIPQEARDALTGSVSSASRAVLGRILSSGAQQQQPQPQ